MKKTQRKVTLYDANDARVIPMDRLLDALGVKYDKRGLVKCPFPEPHKHGHAHPSARVYLKKNKLHCFVCGESWSTRVLKTRKPALKVLIVIIFPLLLATASYGQQATKSEPANELSFVMYGSTPVPWYFHTQQSGRLAGFTEDIRYNFDQLKTVTLCLGESFGTENFSVNPEACGYVGLYNGYGPELWITSDTKTYSVTSYLQYAKFTDTNNFSYGWLQANRKIGKMIEVGVGNQFLKDGVSTAEFSTGPAVRMKFGRFFASFVPLFGTTGGRKGKVKPYLELGATF